jgi:hypothetical protein
MPVFPIRFRDKVRQISLCLGLGLALGLGIWLGFMIITW